MSKYRNVLLLSAVGAGFFAASASSEAALVLRLTNDTAFPASVITIADGSGLDGSPGVDGRIIFSQVISGVDISITVAFSNAPGSTSAATLQISELAIQSFASTPRSMRVQLTDDSFTLPGTIGSSLALASSVSGTYFNSIGSSVQFFSTASPDLAVTPTLGYTSVTGFNDQFSAGNNVPFNRTGTPFTVSNDLLFTVLPGGQANLVGTTSVIPGSFIPEPTSLATLLVGGTLLARRRR